MNMNMQVLLKQAQKMQKEVTRAEEELKEKVYTSSAGGGIVKATIKGTMEVVSIEIQEELLQPEGKDDLQEMLKHTINDALQQASKDKETVMKQLTGGVKMPGVF